MSKQQDRHQRDHSPEDKPESLNHTQKPAPSPLAAAPLCQLLKNPYQSPFQIPLATALAESPVITHPASSTGTAASNPKSLLGLYPEVPLSGRGRAGGRLGVSFCFSRRGPRLEPSASVFSDLEEEERDKREQMKERIKGIMEDIYREIEEVEGRKHSESEKFKSCAVGDGPSDTAPIPREAPRDEEEIEKRHKEKEPFPISTAAPDNLNPDSLLRPSQTQTTLCGTEPAGAHTDIKHADGATARKRESEGEWEDNQYMCVQGKDGTTCLKWPVSLIKFTKSQPHICYSSNPLCSNLQQAEQLSQDSKEPEQNLPSALSGKSNPCVPAIITADMHTCLQRRGNEELRAHTQQKVVENLKAQGRIAAEEGEHLFLENGHLSSSETTPETERCTLSTENCASPASHPFDPADSDSSNANFQNPLGGRLGGARRIRERAITALSCKSESVILTGAQGMCISPSRCECGSETTCQCASAPQPYVGVLELSRKRRKASTKKDKLGKKRGKRENTSNKRQSARRKVRSVVSTVSTGTERRREEAGGSWGKRRLEPAGMRRRRVQSAGSSSHPGRCEAEPVSVFVRKRRPHRSPSSESQSEADREQAERCSVSSPLGRHTAHRHTTREARRDRDALTFPWRSHFSLHSLSSGCNSKLSWERGHHSNPRSFIDCCYPDNSCVCSPARKGKVLHRDRIFIHRKRKSLRRHNVWEETGRGGKTAVPSCGRDSSHISDLEEWEWMRGSFPGRRRSRNNVAEWDGLAKFRSSPGSWCRKSSQLGRDDVDWDRCSVDRWTWGSSDSWEDRGTHRSVSGSRRGADSRESPDSVWKCLGSRALNTKQVSSPEWWTSRQTYSPQSAINTRASRGHSPRSCSPCSSTSMSELSWEWSRSSTSSGVDGLTGGSCRSLSGAQGLSSEGPHEAAKQSSPTPSGLNSTSHSSPDKSRLAPPVPGVIKKHCDTNPSQPKELKSQSDLGHSARVTTSTPDATTGLSHAKPGPQKSARTLLLPLIGKLPAIQRKARRKKGFLGRSQEKKAEDKDEAKGNAGDPEAVTNSQKYPPVTAESLSSRMPNPHPSEIRTDDKHVVEETAPPISFTAEEMDKYRLLQEQAREHMQKVLEQTQESADTEANYTHTAQTDERGTSEERYTPAPIHNPALPQSQSIHTDSVQTQARHSLQVSLPIPHVTSQENFSQPIALGVPSLPALRPSPPLPGLHHIILRRAAIPMPPTSSPSPVSSPSPAAVHPHHPLPPPHLSLPHHLHLSPLSISSLFPSILLSHHPIPLLPQSAAFHGTPLAPLPSVTLQPLNPQPFVSTSWPVRFQQKAL